MADTKKTKDTQPAEVAALKNKLYSEALTEIKDLHEDEFEALLEAKYAEHGMVRVNRKAAARKKAEEELARLRAEFPDLFPTPVQEGDTSK